MNAKDGERERHQSTGETHNNNNTHSNNRLEAWRIHLVLHIIIVQSKVDEEMEKHNENIMMYRMFIPCQTQTTTTIVLSAQSNQNDAIKI